MQPEGRRGGDCCKDLGPLAADFARVGGCERCLPTASDLATAARYAYRASEMFLCVPPRAELTDADESFEIGSNIGRHLVNTAVSTAMIFNQQSVSPLEGPSNTMVPE